MERAGSYLGVLDRIVGIDPTGLAGCEANRRGYNLCSGGEGGGVVRRTVGVVRAMEVIIHVGLRLSSGGGLVAWRPRLNVPKRDQGRHGRIRR